MWLSFSLLTALFWGIGYVIVKKGLITVRPLFAVIIVGLCAMFLYIPFGLLNGVNFHNSHIVFILSILVALAYLSWFYIIDKGNISLVGTIIAGYPIITIVLSFIFLHERVTFIQNVGIILALVGTILIAFPTDLGLLNKVKLEGWVWWAIFGTVTQGIADFIAKVAINLSDAATFMFFFGLAYIPICILFIVVDKVGRQSLPSKDIHRFFPAIIGTIMIMSGTVFFNLAFFHGPASLVSPVSTSYVVITVILAYWFLKERITKLQFIGIISTIVGVFLLSVPV